MWSLRLATGFRVILIIFFIVILFVSIISILIFYRVQKQRTRRLAAQPTPMLDQVAIIPLYEKVKEALRVL